MGIISRFAQIDKKFAWSFLGFLLAAIFGGIAIYTEFYRDNSPLIKYEVLSNTKILDVKEDVGGLSIIYNNEDIKKFKKTLSILAVKISNEGRSAILKSYYDEAAPLGLVINTGVMIKGEIISATTTYLQENAGVAISKGREAEFSDVIIEPTESFTAKFLILNPENTTITILPKGKIAGVRKIDLSDQLTDQKKESFMTSVISGSSWVQLARVPIYTFGPFIAIGVFAAPVVWLAVAIGQRKKGKIIKQFKTYTENKYDEQLGSSLSHCN